MHLNSIFLLIAPECASLERKRACWDGAEVSPGPGVVQAALCPPPRPSCPNSMDLMPSHGLALSVVKFMNSRFLFLPAVVWPSVGHVFQIIIAARNLLLIRAETKITLLLAMVMQEKTHPGPGPPQPPFIAPSVSGWGICCVLQPFLAISPRRTCLVGTALRIDPTLASPAVPQHSWVPYLFNSTDKHVPQNHIKVLSKQSRASYRSLLPTTAESGTATPCPVTTQRVSGSVCKIPARSFMMKSNIFSGIKF